MPQPQISPQPVPTLWGLDHTQDGAFVVLVANTHLGQAVYFLSAQSVEQFAAAIMDQLGQCAAAQQTARLAVPPTVLLGPDGAPVLTVDPLAQREAQREAQPEAPSVALNETENPPPPDLSIINGGSEG